MIPRIAVFEPSASILRLFHTQLKLAGFQTNLHQDMFKRVSQLASPLPDLVILGSIRGYIYEDLDALYILRSVPALRGIPFLICTTGYVDDKYVSLLRPTRLLSLPFTGHTLITAVNQLLQSSTV
jgi:DNA-binding response OmpR family regulator